MHVLRRREEPADRRRHHRGTFRAALGRHTRSAGLRNETVAEAFLSTFLANRPVHATFMGLEIGDGDLPRADDAAMRQERRAFAALAAELAGRAEPEDAGGRLDLRIAQAETAIALTEAEHRPRQRNPAWYTGEAMFGIISLLLPQ